MSTTKRTATISVWGKGFRVTQESEEFQRLVPRERAPDSTTPLETTLDKFDGWPSLLQPLYAMAERELATQRCVLFRESEVVVCAVARSEDRHKRTSILFVAARAQIDWETDPVPEVVAQCHALASRLATAYAATFRGSPERILTQLRAGTFVRADGFRLDDEEVNVDEWTDVITAVGEWRGITGVATPRLIALGANIVIGTQHEAETIGVRGAIDGFFDVRTKAISPLSEKISKWHRPVPPPVEPPPLTPTIQDTAFTQRIESIDRNLQGVNHSIGRMADAFEELCQRIIEFWIPDQKKRKR